VLLAEAQRQAEAILVEADALDAKRASLDELAVSVTALQRRGGAMQRQGWPASIISALSPELRAQPRLPSRFSWPLGESLVQRWTEIAARLAQDPEAEITP
jgi:hypothetical protein